MKHKGLLIAFVLFMLVGGAFLFGLVISLITAGSGDDTSWSFGDRVGVITVDGTIISADRLVQDIDRFRNDSDIRSVVLRLESPGGSVAASQEILEAVRRLAQKKPVIASMGSVATSGAYYVACGATKILANPGTITGSIGVRMEHVMIGDLLTWAKIKHETLKSGRMKDLGAFDRPMTPEERQILQTVLDDIHGQFKAEVAKARGLEPETVDRLADGRIYTGQEALSLKLVDRLGGFSEAIQLAAAMGGIRGEPKLVHPKRRSRVVEHLFETAGTLLKDPRKAMIDSWQPLLLMKAE
jgi:protease-4